MTAKQKNHCHLDYAKRENKTHWLLYLSGKDKGGPSKGGFLNDILFSWVTYYLYTHTINFITQI